MTRSRFLILSFALLLGLPIVRHAQVFSNNCSLKFAGSFRKAIKNRTAAAGANHTIHNDGQPITLDDWFGLVCSFDSKLKGKKITTSAPVRYDENGKLPESDHVSALSGATVTIDTSRTFQTIDGFGGAQPGGDSNQQPKVQDSATPLFLFPNRDRVMDLLFSPDQGIGLTILRMKINAMLESSPGVFNDTDPAQQWIIQQASARGPVKTIASSWSPPAWMKTNNATNEGALRLDKYQAYADLIAFFAGQWATHNAVNIYAISFANEPDIVAGGAVDWDTCTWTPVQYRNFLANNLLPTLSANNISIKIMAPEVTGWGDVEPFMTNIYADPATVASVDIVAGHLYDNNPSEPFPIARYWGKKVWQSEFVTGNTWTIDEPLNVAKSINDGLTRAQINAWVWFVMFSGPAGAQDSGALIGFKPEVAQNSGALIGCSPGDVNGCSVDKRVEGSRMYWVLGNFSKFIRPGYVRVGSETANSPLLDASAYRDPMTGKLVIVVINRNTVAVDVTFRVPGFFRFMTPYVTSATQDLEQQLPVAVPGAISAPARSVVTYTGDADQRFLDASYNGGNGPSDGSFYRPYTSFTEAVPNTPAGGTLWLLRTQTIPAVGTYDKRIAIKAAPGVQAILGN